ncbi:MAG: DUF2849 domain-containing protein [Rhodospirillales bacterium]|nr:DUF2849 domain-containing protein [Rhodospirillales bacterium]
MSGKPDPVPGALASSAAGLRRIVTANRLRDGRVVFLTGAGWSSDVAKAQALSPAEAEAALELVSMGPRTEVIAAYATEIDADGLPKRVRERIRVAGPSVRTRRAPVEED